MSKGLWCTQHRAMWIWNLLKRGPRWDSRPSVAGVWWGQGYQQGLARMSLWEEAGDIVASDADFLQGHTWSRTGAPQGQLLLRLWSIRKDLGLCPG